MQDSDQLLFKTFDMCSSLSVPGNHYNLLFLFSHVKKNKQQQNKNYSLKKRESLACVQ